MDAVDIDKAGHIEQDQEDAGPDGAEGVMKKMADPVAEAAPLLGVAWSGSNRRKGVWRSTRQEKERTAPIIQGDGGRLRKPGRGA